MSNLLVLYLIGFVFSFFICLRRFYSNKFHPQILLSRNKIIKFSFLVSILSWFSVFVLLFVSLIKEDKNEYPFPKERFCKKCKETTNHKLDLLNTKDLYSPLILVCEECGCYKLLNNII